MSVQYIIITTQLCLNTSHLVFCVISHDEAPLSAARRPWLVRPMLVAAHGRGKSEDCVYRLCRGLTSADFLQCTRQCLLGDGGDGGDGHVDGTGHGPAEVTARQHRRKRRSVPDSREQHTEEQAWDTARAGGEFKPLVGCVYGVIDGSCLQLP